MTNHGNHFKTLMAAVLAIAMTACLFTGCGAQAPGETTAAAPAVLSEDDRVLKNADPQGISENAFGTDIKKNAVLSVEFFDNQDKAPADAVDVSETGNGGVLLWSKEEEGGLQRVYIAGAGKVIAPADCSYLFSSNEDLRKLGNHFRSLRSVCFWDALDAGRAKNLSHMFEGCEKLEDLETTGFTAEAAVDTSYMFADCRTIQNLALLSFNVTEVTNVSNMFRYCVNLTALNLGNFRTGKVTDMSEMFSFCYNMPLLILKNFDTSSAEDMSKMFYQCKNLKALDVSSFTTPAAKNLSNMFASCKSLESLDLTGFQLGEKVNLKDIFNHCPKTMELKTDNEKLQNLFSLLSE